MSPLFTEVRGRGILRSSLPASNAHPTATIWPPGIHTCCASASYLGCYSGTGRGSSTPFFLRPTKERVGACSGAWQARWLGWASYMQYELASAGSELTGRLVFT